MNLRRFVSYIYQYEQGKRGRNMGFIKVDMREGGCRMELQVRGQERMLGRGRIYLAVEDGRLAVPAGDMAFGQGGGRVKLFFNRNLLGDSGYTAEQIQAVVVRCDGGRLLISCWAEHVPEEVLLGQFAVWSAAEESSPEEPGRLEKAEGTDALEQNNKLMELEEDGTEEVEEAGEPGVVGIEGAMGEGQTAWGNVKEAPEEIHQQREEVCDMDGGLRGREDDDADDRKVEVKKIEITDIRGLPKSNWHLCSNSFLIHGFFNYRYLILKTVEKDGQKTCWIGVPGIYEQPERMMALMFGFPEFEPAKQGRESQDAAMREGRSGVGVFGYWMCRLNS